MILGLKYNIKNTECSYKVGGNLECIFFKKQILCRKRCFCAQCLSSKISILAIEKVFDDQHAL